MRDYIKCPKCKGIGKIENPVFTGQLFKKGRKIKRISLREMARRLDFSPTYICDLEHGRRNWNQEIKDKYLNVLGWPTPNAPEGR